MKIAYTTIATICLLLACISARGAENDDWNLPASQRVAEGEAAAGRGDIAGSERILKQLESEAKAAGTLAERTTAEARVDRLRLALARGHAKAGTWDSALTLLKAIESEGKSPAIQRAICAAMLDALKPVLLEADGQCVTPWTPSANDKAGPQQPDVNLRAPYTKLDRHELAELISTALTALTTWERLEAPPAGTLTDSEQNTIAALKAPTRALVRYAWGLSSPDAVNKAIDALPAAERRPQVLRLTQIMLREHDLARAVPRLLELEKAAKDDVSVAAAEELLRISCAYERLHTSLPMWNPGVAEAVKPYLADPAWAERREKIVHELDKAIGAVDLRVVLGESSLLAEKPNEVVSTLESAPANPTSNSGSDVVVPPDILAKAELGDHYETINPDSPDTHSARYQSLKDKAADEKESPAEKAARQKLDSERQKREGEKPNRYRKLGYLAGVLRKNVLLDLDPKVVSARDARPEYELQVDHQEFMIEALGPEFQKDTSQGFRPFTPDSPMRVVVLTRYHGEIEVEARQLPNRDAFENLDGGVNPDFVAHLPVVKTYTIAVGAMAENLQPLPTKSIYEIKNHGLTPGFYVLTARARYSPVVAVTRVAISETKVIVRYAPKEILVWTLDRVTGVPHASKLKGEIKPLFKGEAAWGGAPLPKRDRFDAIDAARFHAGLGDELNQVAVQNADESYLAGVSEGKKLHEKFQATAVPLPAETDANGLARIELPPHWRGHRCQIHVVADGCEVDAIHDVKDVITEKVERVVDWVADRPIARPGQTVRIHGLVRENHNGRMVVAQFGSVPLKLTLGNATLFDAALPVDEEGRCDVEQIIDADATDDILVAHTPAVEPLCAVLGGEVATRRVRLELPQHPVSAGSRVKARAIVENASGIPLAGIALKIEARFYRYQRTVSDPLPFGEQFQRATAESSGAELAAWNMDRELVSGSNGEVEFQVEVPEDANTLGTVQVIAPGGQRAQASAEARVLGISGACIYHADRIPESPAGRPAHVSVVARTLEDAPYTKPFYVADMEGRVLATLTPDADGRGSADVQASAQNTFLQIRPVANGDGAWAQVIFTKANEATEVRGERGVLAARMDRTEYRIGDTARVLIRADRPGLKVLLTTESSGVTRAQLVNISTRSAAPEIQITDGDAPNATVALTVLADDKVECVLLPLSVAQSERKLDVQLTSDKLTTEPGQTVQLTARVKDSRGQPVANADVVAVAFDRQLLSLASDPAPEFGLPFLHAGLVTHDVAWTTGFNTFSYGSAFLWLTPEWSFGPYGQEFSGSGTGIGEGSGRGSFGMRNGGGRRLMVKRYGGSRARDGVQPFRVRARFSEQALWSTNLKTGADGTVTFPFAVPDNLTTFRVVAYALDSRGYPGNANLDISVQRDLEVSLDLPPEFHAGDHAQIALSVWNYTEKSQSVTLTPHFPLPVLSAQWMTPEGAKAVPDNLDVPPHGSASVAYMLDVKIPEGSPQFDQDAGALRFQVNATSPDGKKLDDAVFQAPLRLVGRTEQETTQVAVRAKGSMHVPFNGSFDPQCTSLTLTIRRGLRGLAMDIRELQYIFPEHCPEQTLSRFVPAMVLATAIPDDQQSAEDHEKLERVLKSGIARMRTLEHTSMPQELQPLEAWYLRRLSEVPAGWEALKTNGDWRSAANLCEMELLAGDAGSTKNFPALTNDIAAISAAYGGFRKQLWCALGSAQLAPSATGAYRREIRARYSELCQSCVAAARAQKLKPQDRALAALLAAQLGYSDYAAELLRLRVKDNEQLAPKQTATRADEWQNQHSRTLALALDVVTAVELKKPEAEILDLALRLQSATQGKGTGFGTTFLNGVGLLALADAMKTIGATKNDAGPMVVKLGNTVVGELPAGGELRRITVDRRAVEAAFRDGWDFSVEVPEGQVAGIALERRTLLPEKLEVKSAEAVNKALEDFAIGRVQSDNAELDIHRCLFVRPPADQTVAVHQNWRPYAGQPLPVGTELLVLTKFGRAASTEFVQIEIPTLPGWESMTWDASSGTKVEYLHAVPGMLAGSELADVLSHEPVDGKQVAAKVQKAVRERRWGVIHQSLEFEKEFSPARFNDRGARQVSVLYAPQKTTTSWVNTVIAQSGVLRQPGRYQLPGARAWLWYGPVDISGSGDLVQVADGAEGTLESPGSPLASQDWLEKSWSLLANEGWNTTPAVVAGDSVDLHSLALLGLGRSTSEHASELAQEWVNLRGAVSSFEAFCALRARRIEVIRNAAPETLSEAVRAALLQRYDSWEGLSADWKGLGLGAQKPPELAAISSWLDEEKARAKELLPLLPVAARANGVAFQKLSVRDVLQHWFGADQGAAAGWLWDQPAEHFIRPESGSLDQWTVQLRTAYGLDLAVDSRAPVVLTLPVPFKNESLKHYVQNRLAEMELSAHESAAGKWVLTHIGDTPDEKAAPLDAKAVMTLRVYGSGDWQTHNLREALALRGVQLVMPEGDMPASPAQTVRELVLIFAKNLKRGVRVENDVIELK